MSALRWVAPVLLALVLAASAGAKLATRSATGDSFATLGLPAPRALATLVPLVELLTAVALVAVPRIGGVVALVLLAAFSVFLARRIAQGSEAPCACFGQTRRRPVSPADLARNAVLAALAAVTIAFPPS
jgi:uncharacterized membrane protein YphA (DoxX/SURF4 family)